MDIKKISIKNFRVFKEKTTFELRPFTILTGPNNSGKSSFIKFLQLMKEGVFNLNFDSGKHNLENFENVLNWHQKDNSLEIEIQGDNESKIIYKYLYDENLSEIECYDEDKLIFNVSRKKCHDSESNQEYTHCILFYNLDSIYEKETKHFNGFFHNDEIHFREHNLFFKILYNKEDITLNFINEIKEFQKKLLDIDFQIETNKYGEHIELNFGLDSFIENILYENFSESDIDLKIIKTNSYFEGFSKQEISRNLEIKFSWFGDFELGGSSKHYSGFGGISSKIFSQIKSLSFVEKELHHLSASRGTQQRVLMNNSAFEINDIILEFSKRKIIHKEFLLKCFRILGIEGELQIKRYENTISVVKIIRNNIEFSLADLGFGYSQILPIVLKIHNLLPDYQVEKKPESNFGDLSAELKEELLFDEIQEEKDKENGTWVEKLSKQYSDYIGNNRYFLLEEPEANLHPNLQSKLAELLVYIESVFDIKFIIETHSEYFIRKLQYLTAKNDLKAKDSVIYYFNDDKYVSKTEPKVKEIFINEDGGLTDSFGPGFFDEATKLQFDLIRLQKQQMN